MTVPTLGKRATPVDPTPAEASGGRRAFDLLTGNWVFLALVVIIAFFTVQGGTAFFSFENFSTMLANNGVVIFLAIGMTLLIIGGQLDLSIGSVLVFSSVVGSKVIVSMAGAPVEGVYPHALPAIVVGILVSTVVGGLWGLFNGILVTRLKIPSFIVTLGTLGMALGLAQVITSGTDVTGLPTSMAIQFGAKNFLGITLPVWIAVLLLVIIGLVLATTQFGRYTYATGSNSEAARRSGIRVDRQVIILFTLMGLLSGLAGILEVSRLTTTGVAGHGNDALLAISAVIIGGASLFGGRGTMFGTAVGVLIPIVLTNGLIIIGVQPFWQTAAIGAILIVAVTADQLKRTRLLKG
jgi:ribose transport system permease protein